MVSTRGHPQEFAEPDLASSKSSPTNRKDVIRSHKWAHTPSNLTLIWLFISLPLVVWDAGYVLLRPHSMPGGKYHWPLWQPYELYGRVDYIYGWKAFNAKNGFTAAQTSLNVVETLMYIYYLYIVFVHGKSSVAPGRGVPDVSKVGFLGQQRSVSGPAGILALLVVYSAAVMTLSKTALYWANEYYSGFDNIGHNNARDLLFLWIIPNGAWLVLPAYIIYVAGSEISQGLLASAGAPVNSSEEKSSGKAE
ncbi:hypothetical protein B0O99DRAFT_622169 [Bisporella sp. PMI_857]|nr:hypothetical protein B0O99DRAFT_622169 [Bisporella sp. PMI_857]